MNKQWCDSFTSSSVSFTEHAGGLVSVRVDNALATAQILLQGAQVLSFVPKGEQDLLWLSGDARYEVGRPVRGGIPICWPWFGASKDKPQAPAHGFARNLLWQLSEVTDLADGATHLLFTLGANDVPAGTWPHLFELQYRVIVGRSLGLNLTTTNLGKEEWRFTEALHSYLAVQSIESTCLSGFSEVCYQDKLLTGDGLQTQKGDVVVTAELDRIYQTAQDQSCPHTCVLLDSQAGRAIKVEKSGSASTVVWNPWIAKAQALVDFSNTGYQTMLCVEAGNTEHSEVSLKPGERHTLRQVLGLV